MFTSPLPRAFGGAAAILAAALVASASSAFAQSNYPDRPITLIAPYSVGGDADAAARNFAAVASQVLGQSMIVVNKAGASGTIGSNAVVTAPPDGYTLLLARTGSQSIMPAIDPRLAKYKWDDYTFISTLEINPYGCVVNANSPHRTFQELAEAMKKSGRSMNYGTAGVNTTNDLGPRELFRILKLTTEQTPTAIPYKGTGDASASLLGGITQFSCGSLGAFLSLHRAGQLRILMTTTPERLAALPDVPTARELGHQDMEAIVGWSGLFGPPKMPPEIRDKLYAAVKKVAEDPKWIAATATTGSVPSIRTPDETRDFMKGQHALYQSIGESLGIIDSKK